MNITCKHNMAERDTAIADGMCPMCLADAIDEVRNSLEASLKREVRLLELLDDFPGFTEMDKESEEWAVRWKQALNGGNGDGV